MALKATIFKASLQVSDMDRHYYAEHQLTLARHPSETDQRMMVRLLLVLGIPEEDITPMVRENPAHLLGLDPA